MAVEPEMSRSRFVTVVAWLFIVLAGFAVLVSSIQNIVVSIMFSNADLASLIEEARRNSRLPAFVLFTFEHLRFALLGFLISFSITLLAAIGVLRRKDWARRLFVAILAIGIVWSLAGAGATIEAVSSVSKHVATRHDELGAMIHVILAFNLLVSLVVATVFLWLIKRFVSDDIKREFRGA